MKKFWTVVCAFALAMILAVYLGAQGKIVTRKIKLSDFPVKTTKVVLSGNVFQDETLKSEVIAKWRLSPYEFCSVGEYESLKGKEGCYFLSIAAGKLRKETTPGICWLTLEKSGPDSAADYMSEGFEVISIPLSPVENPSGREAVYLGTFIEIIQKFVQESMTSDKSGYTGLASMDRRMTKCRNKSVHIAAIDLAEGVTGPSRPSRGIYIEDEDYVDEIYEAGITDALVSYVVVSSDPEEKASMCYMMLLSADTHELYYYGKHRYSAKSGAGFSQKEIDNIAASLK